MEEAIEVLLSLKSMKIKQDLVALKELFLAQCYLSSNKAAKFKDSFIRLTQHEEFFNQVPDVPILAYLVAQILQYHERRSQEALIVKFRRSGNS